MPHTVPRRLRDEVDAATRKARDDLFSSGRDRHADSTGSVTAPPMAMAQRLRTCGFPTADIHVWGQTSAEEPRRALAGPGQAQAGALDGPPRRRRGATRGPGPRILPVRSREATLLRRGTQDLNGLARRSGGTRSSTSRREGYRPIANPSCAHGRRGNAEVEWCRLILKTHRER